MTVMLFFPLSAGSSFKCGYVWKCSCFRSCGALSWTCCCCTKPPEPPRSGPNGLFRSEEVQSHLYSIFPLHLSNLFLDILAVLRFVCLFGALKQWPIMCYFQFVQSDDDKRQQLWDACSSTSPCNQAGLPLLTLPPPPCNAWLSCFIPLQGPEPGLCPRQPAASLSVPLPPSPPGQPSQSNRHLPKQCACPSGSHPTKWGMSLING